jgi:MoxR-like ATPase
MLRIVSAQLEKQLQRHYSPVHVAARLAQLDEILDGARVEQVALAARAAELAARLAPRLWWPPALAQRVQGAHAQTIALLQALIARLEATRAGFAALPLDDGAAAEVPAPVVLDAQPA